MSVFRAEIVNSVPGKRWGYTQPLPGARLALQSHDNTTLCVTDYTLEPLWDCLIPAFRGFHAVSSDLSRVAVTLLDEIRLLDSRGMPIHAFRHRPWGGDAESGACAFDRGGAHLWAMVPADGDVDIVLLTLDDLQVVDRRRMETRPAGAQAFHHPNGRSIGWAIGEGQDRVLIRWTALANQRIDARLLPDEDRVLAAIHPAGTEYLTTPHYRGPLQRHRFDDDAVIQGVDPQGELGWDYVAGYLGKDRILAAVYGEEDDEGLVVLDSEPLRIAGEVIAEGSANRWASMAWIGEGRWVTVGDQAADMWRLRADV